MSSNGGVRLGGHEPNRWCLRLIQRIAVSGSGGVRLRTLTLMRWVAVIGQAFTVLLVHGSLGIVLPMPPLVAAIALSALINLVLTFGCPASVRLNEGSAALLLGYDILQLAFMLELTGGLQNPFALLLLVPLTLSATILSLRTTVLLCLFVLTTVSVLALYPTALPWRGGGLMLPELYRFALWIAFGLGTVLIAGYAWRVAEEARRMSDALAATQMALAREQQLSALGAHAAAAAHELGSPLGTVVVTANELARAIPPDSPLAEDAQALLQEAQRCRSILASFSRPRAGDDHRGYLSAPLSGFLETVAADYVKPNVVTTVLVERIAADAGPEPRLTPTPELRHAFGNLIDNAVRFAAGEVRIWVRLATATVSVVIEDDGPGFDEEILSALGEPYLSTRRRGGGMGLGVFIAVTLLARSGARVNFDNTDRGARVTVAWSRAALDTIRRRGNHERLGGAAFGGLAGR